MVIWYDILLKNIMTLNFFLIEMKVNTKTIAFDMNVEPIFP